VTRTRRAAFIPDDHPSYTDSIVVDELNGTFANVFEAIVVEARGGFWRKRYDQPLVAQQARYRIHPRACAVEAVAIADSSGKFVPLDEATPRQIDDLRGGSGSSSGRPLYYTVDGDMIELLPQPNSASYTLRQSYYVRPSRLVTQQSSTLGGGTIRGLITARDPVARTITVNVVPFDQELAVPAAITSALQQIDVVHPDGYHELALVGATQSLAGSVFTVGGTQSMQDVQVGDFVRAAEQTDWPCLPDEFHQTLADACAVRFLLQLGFGGKARDLAAKIGLTPDGLTPHGTDLARFRKLITPRVKTSPKRLVRRTGILAGSRRSIPTGFIS
jgi:hypothetical protein